MKRAESPEEFQEELFELIKRLLPVDGLRFNVYLPRISLDHEVWSGDGMRRMTKEYADKFWLMDPMHPSKYDESEVKVISNSMLMTNIAWAGSQFFKEFFEPKGYFHNADVFFRKSERIIAVLSLLRSDKAKPFTATEVKQLETVQPFIQYALSNIYLPQRIHDRSTLAEEFELTPREIDVVEIALTGASNKILVQQLKISLPTLRTHLQNIYAKVGVHSNSELISKLLGKLV